ncbi:transducin/WD40 repeat-like superfamily protein [Actinidia rufa]|uniref:Transducin/WD40 repeat-like superfamily protein n=1 Tax=Actinidia rufa TaxID=165716 RepID=A0A7J0FJ38_9ERIC|nr:transducin/WD40 repeat-like superfamily protein [Actinidia rufa]
MEGMEMEVEEAEPTPNPKHSKRFGLKNAIQTNFGDDYVFQIAPKDDLTSMAVSLSTNAVKLYSPATAWDTRSFHQVSAVNAGPSQDIFSFSFGGSGDNLLAAGSKSQIFFWDWRTKKQIACLEESHMDDVTQCLGLERDARIEVNFDDARSSASDSWALDQVDYFVDCHYSGEGDQLWVIGGTNAGTLGYFSVNYKGKGTIGSPQAVLHGGHTGVVRSVLPLTGMQGGPTHARGIFGWTGGEDGRLCCWMSDESSDVNHSWISKELVIKSPRTRKKSRHHPY